MNFDDRTPETWVLNSILRTGGDSIDGLGLEPNDFERGDHARIFGKMLDLRRQGITIEPIALTEALPNDTAAVWNLYSSSEVAVGIDHYVDMVHTHSTRRRLSDLSEGLRSFEAGMTSNDMVEYARTQVEQIAGVKQTKSALMPDLLTAALAEVTEQKLYTPTIWPSLNQAMGGLKPGALYVVGARPGVGKSVVALNLSMGLGAKGTVAFSSLEMSRNELTLRGLASMAEVDVSSLTRGELNQSDWERIEAARPRFNRQVAIDDRPGVGPGQIRAFARSIQRGGNLVAVVVDYLQLMMMPGREPRHEKVSEMSRQLKMLAKDLHIPVIALSQLNRRSETAPDKRPTLSDLRESGSIEQDADVVILLSKPDDRPGDIDLDVAKNRHGRLGVVTLAWRGEYSRIDDFQWHQPGGTHPWR